MIRPQIPYDTRPNLRLPAKARTPTYGFLNRSYQAHWLSVLIALVAVLLTLVYAIVASKGYTTELAVPGFSGGSQVGLQRFEDEYLAELSRYLVDQVQRELKGTQMDMQDAQQEMKDTQREMKNTQDEIKDMKNMVQESLEAARRLAEEAAIKAEQEKLQTQEVKHVGIDYASIYSGCKVYEHSPTHVFGSDAFKIMSVTLFNEAHGPQTIIERLGDNLIPGLCWAFKGGEGHVMLQLSEPAKINEIVYEHVGKDIEPPKLFGSTPRSIEVWGGIEPTELKFLGETEFVRNTSYVRIFVEEQRMAKYIKFTVSDNYGADFTCLYRVYVYATPANPE